MPCCSLRNKHIKSPLETKDFIESFEKIGFKKAKQENFYQLNDVTCPILIREKDLRLMFNTIIDQPHLGHKTIPKEIRSILERICISLKELCRVFLNQLTEQEYLIRIKLNNALS